MVIINCPDCGDDHPGLVCTVTGHAFKPSGAELRSGEYVPPLVSLPGAKVSPEVLLHRTLNKLARIKAVTVIIQWDDDTFDCDWSSMKTSELCMAEKVLDEEVRKDLRR